MSYLSGVVAGTTLIGSALVLGASGNISGISSLSASNLTGTIETAAQPNITSIGSLTGLTISGNLSFSGSSRSILITGASSYIDAREYRQSGTMYDLSLLQYISGDSFGSATALNVLLCDSSLNIANINMVSATTLSCTNLRQGLTYYDLSSLRTSIPASLSINNLSTIGDISCSGVINAFLAYGNQSAITTLYANAYVFGINITPIQFQIEVHNETNSTSNNASWIGNITNNDLRFGTNNSTTMILTTLGNTNPSAALHVPSSNKFVFGAGGTTVYRLRTDSGATESALGPITYSVAGIFGGYIACTAMAMASVRRLKKNTQPIDRVKRLYDSCEVNLYEWNESENKPGQEVGLIAQDLVSAHLTDLTSVFYGDDIEEGKNPSFEPAHLS
ncbi:unnamed protein product [Phytophthora lilii]|uniref:Unnamed protein product n=1 Tax=Phytophthora lilii TaxID=2077276 RepID=A0A9W6XB57_9STRA|nr:unnamed protein product [Phytophthora lilii]